MTRKSLVMEVSRHLGSRKVVWAGIRGDDVESLAELEQLGAVYSIIAAYRNRYSVDGVALEENMKRRVDLEVWDIDDHRTERSIIEFRRSLLRALGVSSALVPYRPSRFLSAIWFARRDRCLHLGLFGAHQFAFEHKPWVETAVDGLGVPIIPWTYVADEEQLKMIGLLDEGPVVLRKSRTSGGQGFYQVETAEDLEKFWPESDEAFVSVAPYLANAIPINVGGTVWHDGVSVHYPSVQLVGVRECVTRPFGYCGNDFFAARNLEPAVIEKIEIYTRAIGTWLSGKGYLGTFGVDYLLEQDGVLRFTEVNPRFQGSTAASGRISVEADQPCLPLEHLAAHMGISMPPQVPLVSRVREMNPVSQIVVHWIGQESRELNVQFLKDFVAKHDGFSDVSAKRGITVDPGAAAIRLTLRDSVTQSGADLAEPYSSTIGHWQRAMMDRVAEGICS